jgi:hypothetical protein
MPCLLLDVDGVILRDKLLLAHVKHNATNYVRNKLPECKDAATVNNSLFLAYGHTARGLQTGFGIDARDYNEQVYDKSLMAHLAEVIEGTEFQRDAEYINNTINNGWPVTLFSNAPHCWLDPVARAISDQVKIRCPGPDLSTSYLKPEFGFYKEFDDCTDYYFIDDSLKNLGAVRNMKNWYPVHFTNEFEPHSWCPQISHLRNIHQLVLGYYKMM